MTKKFGKFLAYAKPYMNPFFQGVLCGCAGFLVFVFASARFGACSEWICKNVILGTFVFGGSLILYTSMRARRQNNERKN